ncbi:hypothetical protein H5J24_01425 [Chryseobacterium capnotolerans]|uniref:hypothetical protein n=1 Tax=Chryseobacterium TaxID=59732 RepID=UPI00083A28AB|nr:MULTISPECIES: hypothetical protein [Chryseobacterium]UHO38875.1 hypothetical protein H5J24_01425 [Chryseobacterium capnotolerans]
MSRERVISTLKKYFTDFVLIFISVILAFILTEWSANQGEKVSQSKILTEIHNGLQSDTKDFKANRDNHKISIRGVQVFRNWTSGKPVPQDSIALYYYALFRNYTPIINKTGYESLKANNLKTITNDSLRFGIISLYDYHYQIIEKLENSNSEMQDFTNYFKATNDIIHPYLIFDEKGNTKGLQLTHKLSENQKKELMSYFWRMELNKKFKVMRYNEVIKKQNELQKSISEELKKD